MQTNLDFVFSGAGSPDGNPAADLSWQWRSQRTKGWQPGLCLKARCFAYLTKTGVKFTGTQECKEGGLFLLISDVMLVRQATGQLRAPKCCLNGSLVSEMQDKHESTMYY